MPIQSYLIFYWATLSIESREVQRDLQTRPRVRVVFREAPPPIPTPSLSLTTASSGRHPNLWLGWTHCILFLSSVVDRLPALDPPSTMGAFVPTPFWGS